VSGRGEGRPLFRHACGGILPHRAERHLLGGYFGMLLQNFAVSLFETLRPAVLTGIPQYSAA
jgi:hypothetical protein